MCAGPGASLSEIELLRERDDAYNCNGENEREELERGPGMFSGTGTDSEDEDFVAQIRAQVAQEDEDEELLEADRILDEAKRAFEEYTQKNIAEAMRRVEAGVGTKGKTIRRPPKYANTELGSRVEVKPEAPEDIKMEEEEIDDRPISPSRSHAPSLPESSSRSNSYTRALADLEMSDDEEESEGNDDDEDFVPSSSRMAAAESFICFACGKSFPSSQEMRKHISIIHSRKILQCDVCSRRFQRMHHLLRHIKTHEAPKYKCIHCNLGFSDINSLVIHKGRVHKVNQEDQPLTTNDMVKCKRCSKLLKSDQEFKRHDYYCKNATKIQKERKIVRETRAVASPAMSTISYSSAASSPRTPTRPKLDQRCQICQQTFASRQSLLRHTQRKHPEKYEENASTRCYQTSELLPFKCSECGKSFAKEEALASHYRRHFTTKNHACPHPDCGKSYAQASELRKHAKRTHQIDL